MVRHQSVGSRKVLWLRLPDDDGTLHGSGTAFDPEGIAARRGTRERHDEPVPRIEQGRGCVLTAGTEELGSRRRKRIEHEGDGSRPTIDRDELHPGSHGNLDRRRIRAIVPILGGKRDTEDTVVVTELERIPEECIGRILRGWGLPSSAGCQHDGQQ